MKYLIHLMIFIAVLLIPYCKEKQNTVKNDTEKLDLVTTGEETKNDSAKDAKLMRYVASSNGLNMRTEPSVQSKKILTVPYKAEVTLLEEKGKTIKIGTGTGKWSKIEWKKKTGWVFGGFLTSEVESSEGNKENNDSEKDDKKITECKGLKHYASQNLAKAVYSAKQDDSESDSENLLIKDTSIEKAFNVLKECLPSSFKGIDFASFKKKNYRIETGGAGEVFSVIKAEELPDSSVNITVSRGI